MLSTKQMENKKPLPVSRKGLMIQVRLERVDGLGRQHERVLLLIAGVAGESIKTIVVIGVIPADFQAGQHVRPEGILNGGRDFLSLVGVVSAGPSPISISLAEE